MDGNKFLDLFMNISSTAMGHNNPDVLALAKTDLMAEVIANRTAQGIHPRGDWQQILQEAFIDIAPKGMNRVSQAMCGSCAVETAFKCAIITYAQRERGGPAVMPTEEELMSCMKNEMPGAGNKYVVMSFNNGFHGRLFGSLSSSRTKAMHKVDVPSFDWPAVDPPIYKHPMTENEEYNRAQDDAALKRIVNEIDARKADKG